MKPRPPLPLFALLALAAPLASAQRSDLLPTQRRAVTVEIAARILQPAGAAELPANLKNPFAPSEAADALGEATPAAGADAGATRSRTMRETLAVIAANIILSGTVTLRGEPILLFGGRQTRVGDDLVVSYEGNNYVLRITAIEPTSFTVRLNDEELTRPIKPGTNP